MMNVTWSNELPEGSTWRNGEFMKLTEEAEINGKPYKVAGIGYGFWLAIPVGYEESITEAGEHSHCEKHHQSYASGTNPIGEPLIYYCNYEGMSSIAGTNSPSVLEEGEVQAWGPGL